MTCRFPGDFDIQVDYKLLSGPLPPQILQFFNTVEFTGGLFLGGTHGMFVFNPRVGDPGVSTNFPGQQQLPRGHLAQRHDADGSNTSPAPARSRPPETSTQLGRLRTSDPYVSDEVAAALSVFANTFPFPNTTVRVAYDNFRVNSGSISCPTWWTDSSPDWQATN